MNHLLFIVTDTRGGFLAVTRSDDLAKQLIEQNAGATFYEHAVAGKLSLEKIGGMLLGLSGHAAKGAAARNAVLTAEQRREIAVKAANARWHR